MRLILSLLFATLTSLVLTGCPAEGVVCRPGQTACGELCVDVQSDSVNCGACGVTCEESQTCQAGACACRDGASLCGESCTVLANDANHCGACGNACNAGDLCQDGVCTSTCAAGREQCGTACVDLQLDSSNCGACGTACPDVQVCRSGACTYDAVAACYGTGQIIGLNANGQKGALKDVANTVQTLGRFADVVIAADGTDGILRQASLPDLEPLFGENAGAPSPTHVAADGANLYVTSSQSNSVLVYEHTGMNVEGSGTMSPGREFQALTSVFLGDSTWPQAALQVGEVLYVPLQGPFFGADPAVGQKIARIDVSDPAQAAVLSPAYELSEIDLRTYMGATSYAYPQGGVVKGGHVYVPLTNQDPNTFSSGGPGIVVKLDPTKAPGTAGALTPIYLGDECTNAGAITVAGDFLIVSCTGSYVDFTGSAVALIGADDAVKSQVAFTSFNPGRLGVSGNTVFVGSASGPAVATLQLDGETLTSLRTPDAAAGAIDACPVPSEGFTNVSDVLALP